MNLVEVEIENYRQFSGVHRFAPGEQAMVAILGENGAGKTTLFESIEWCLYNPTSIKTADIRNRVYPGNPRVRVTLENPTTGERFEIEREAKKSSIDAAVYRAENPGIPLVQGTRDVTDFVARNLIGLSHKAFVATIFTRQKELSFFGSYRPTERRREVGKLLGLETIRQAQESIAVKRAERRAESQAKTTLLEQQFGESDFDAAEAALAARKQALSLEVGTRDVAWQAANDALAEARKRLEKARERQDIQTRFVLERTELEGLAAKTGERIGALQKTLTELESFEGRIRELKPIAREEPALRERMQQHERAREKHQALVSLQKQQGELTQELTQLQLTVKEIGQRLGTTKAPPVIAEDKPGAFESAVADYLSIAKAADPDSAERFLQLLEQCTSTNDSLVTARTTLERFQLAADQITAKLNGLQSGKDPVAALETARSEVGRAQKRKQTVAAKLEQAQKDHQRLTALRSRLDLDPSTERCPTCDRPFAEGELGGYLDTLTRQSTEVTNRIQQLEQDEASAERALREAADHEQQAQKTKAEIDTLRHRLEDSKSYLNDAATKLVECESEAHTALEAAGQTTLPSPEDMMRAREALRLEREKANQTARLDDIEQRLQRIQRRQTEIGNEIVALGPDHYDASTHHADEKLLSNSVDAASKIAVFTERLESRERTQKDLTSSRGESDELKAKLALANEQIDKHKFDQQEVPDAETAHAHRETERDLAATERDKAVRDLEALEREEQDLAKDKATRDRWQQDVDRALVQYELLDRMYAEFNRFEQSVAQSLTPALSELTSQLVSEITNGKYDRVEFTDDFGVQLFDGNDDAFPLEQFSGGERDVVSLCARLALSQLIGGQAQHPLQFVVLDEVFGSLDRNRRQNLMEMLQQLVQDGGPFRQLFAISHVDDIQHSPAFDEAWKVTERADGISQLEQFTRSTATADL